MLGQSPRNWLQSLGQMGAQWDWGAEEVIWTLAQPCPVEHVRREWPGSDCLHEGELHFDV